MAGMKTIGQTGVVRQSAQGKVVALVPQASSTALVVAGPLGAVPPVLERALSDFIRPMEHGPDRSLVTQSVKDAAAVRHAQLQALLRNATLGEWDDYLFPLCNPMVTANAPDAAAFSKGLPFFVPMIGYMPIGCLTPENRLKLVNRRFFPRPADINEVMGPDKIRLEQESRSLGVILSVKIEAQKPVGQRRAEDELVAWMEEAAQRPDEIRGQQVRACITRLSKVAPTLLERHRARLEAMLPAQAQQAAQAAPAAPTAPQARVLAPEAPPSPEALEARRRLAELARLRQSGRSLADIQREAAKLVKDEG